MLSRSSGLVAAQSVQMIELSLIFVVAGIEEGGIMKSAIVDGGVGVLVSKPHCTL